MLIAKSVECTTEVTLAPGPADPPVSRWLYPAIFVAAVLAYWGPRLFRGFWVDEAGTYWMVHDGWAKISQHIIPSESIIYAHVVALFVSVGAYKEVLLRLPSVAAVLLAGFLVYKLTEAIVGPNSGWLAAIPFVCAGAIVETATNARPYALALAVVLASFWSLREWVHSGNGRWLAGYCLASSAIVYLHYLFAVVFAVQAIYLIAAYRTGRRFSWRHIVAAVAVVAVAAVPLVWQMLTALHSYQNQKWGKAVLPTALAFVSLYPLQVLFPGAVGLILYRSLYPAWFRPPKFPARDDLVLLFTWLLLGPVLVFVLAWTTAYNVFATRYLVYALPPFFILLAWCMRQVGQERGRFALVFAIALCAALYVPQMKMNEWRTPLRIVREVTDAGTPVLVRSGVVQSAVLDWKSEPKPDTFLFAPLTAYPVPNEIIPVPFFVDVNAERYLEQEIQRRAPVHRQFCLVAEKGSDVLATLPAWFQKHGYTASVQEAGGFAVMLFRSGAGGIQ